MKARLVYAVTCCVLLALLVIANQRIDRLEEQSQFWQDAHTSLVRYWLEQETSWDSERTQWRNTADSRGIEYVEVPRVVYEEVPTGFIEHTRIVETVVTENISIIPRQFVSVEEAEAWVSSHALPVLFVADKSGRVKYTNSRCDCDDYAEAYEAMALADGFIISQCPVYYDKVWGYQITQTGVESHVGCITEIQGVYYYIESSPGSPNSFQLRKINSAD